jgi:hypothetical protein
MGYWILLFASHSLGSRYVEGPLFTVAVTLGQESQDLKLIYGDAGFGPRNPENNPSIITFLRNLPQLMHFMGSASYKALYTIFNHKEKEVMTELCIYISLVTVPVQHCSSITV